MANASPPRSTVSPSAAAHAASGAPSPPLPASELAVGVLVVYGSYGIGRVTSRTKATPAGREAVVVDFAKGLSVTLPIERAVECLRPVSGRAELALIQRALRTQAVSEQESWQRRTKTTRGKIMAGDALGLADVVCSGHQRIAALSSYERELYVEARRLLAAEIGASQSIDDEAADAWIEEQLGHALASAEALTG
jgi:RNA polymerase-interacting CarD/CdnL/TRCF family regulator